MEYVGITDACECVFNLIDLWVISCEADKILKFVHIRVNCNLFPET